MCNEKAGLYGQDQIDLVVGIRYILKYAVPREYYEIHGMLWYGFRLDSIG